MPTPLCEILRAIASNGYGRMEMNQFMQFIIEHLGLLRVVVVINFVVFLSDLINGPLKAGDLKRDIPDPVPGS